jgi:hypothetical protein
MFNSAGSSFLPDGFINGMEDHLIVTAVTSAFLLCTYTIMSNDTEKPFIPIPESDTTTALIKATERSFDIIVPLSTTR